MTSLVSLRSLKSMLLATALLGACGEGSLKSPAPEPADDDDDDVCEGSECDEDPIDSDPKSPDARVTDAGQKPIEAGDAGNGKMVPTTDPACEAQSLITKYCSDCHGEKPVGGAPMSLTMPAHYQAAAKDGKKMHAAIKARLHESDPKRQMPPAGYDEPTAAELAKLDAWLDQGAPSSGKTCTSSAPTDGGTTTPPDPEYVPPTDAELECFKITAHAGDMKSPFQVGVAADAYFNLTFAAPWKSVAYGVSFKPIIDNNEVIHHWLLFQDDVPGIPGAVVTSIGAHPVGQLLTGWAPGGDTVDFRSSKADVALELPGDGTTYTMEYHYNSKNPAATDASGVEVCVQRKKPKHLAGLSWLGYDQLLIPSAKWVGTCVPLSQEPIHIVAVTPHMHVQGKHMKGTINRKDGTKEILHDEKFDFDYQKTYTKNAVLMPGDTITTECTFAQPMAFGTQTNAEMCYLFTMAYPKGALRGLDLWGTFAHGGSSCLGM